MVADRERLEAFMARERDYAERGIRRGHERKTAGRSDRPWPELPSERHRQLLVLLRATSRRDTAGRLVSWWPQDKLAAKLGCSVRTLRRLLDDLREPGLDPRHPRGTPPGLRLGLLLVTPTPRRNTKTRGGRLHGGNLYVLVEQQNPRSLRQATLEKPVSAGRSDRPTDPVACLNKGEPPSIAVEGQGSASNNDRLSPDEYRPEAGQDGRRLDHDPTKAEVLATLQASLGDVQ
jgi:hypothetical protein